MNKIAINILIGILLCLWGCFADLLIFGSLLAFFSLLSIFVKNRWSFSKKDISRIFDVSVLFFISFLIYFLNDDIYTARTNILLFLPIAAYPLLILQLFSAKDKIDLAEGFILSRKFEASLKVDFKIIYFFVLIIATANTEIKPIMFMLLFFTLFILFLFFKRSYFYSKLHFIPAALLITATAFFSSRLYRGSVNELRNIMEDIFLDYFNRFQDPYRTKTSIGEIFGQKNSGKIIVRLKADKKLNGLYLKSNSFNIFKNNEWFNVSRKLYNLKLDNNTYIPGSSGVLTDSFNINIETYNGKALLFYPYRTKKVILSNKGKLDKNGAGVLKFSGEDDYIDYLAFTSDKYINFDDSIRKNDKFISTDYAAEMQKFIKDTGIKVYKDTDSTIISLLTYFKNNYYYSLKGKAEKNNSLSTVGIFYIMKKKDIVSIMQQVWFSS